jgi:hypothetical protein
MAELPWNIKSACAIPMRARVRGIGQHTPGVAKFNDLHGTFNEAHNIHAD